MRCTDQVNATIASNNHAPHDYDQSGKGDSTSNENNNEGGQLQILGQLKTIEQINEQRRIFLKSTIDEMQEEPRNAAEIVADTNSESPPVPRKQPTQTRLALSVKYGTLPLPTLATSTVLRSPPPKPPMLSRTRSTGFGDACTTLTNGDLSLLRNSITEATITGAATAPVATPSPATTSEQTKPTATISAKHYESLIEELRCPGCAGPMKAPVLLCKSGHSVCEQCTRILLMCPLCKEGFTNSRSLTIEALCAKAHFRCSFGAGGCLVRMPVALLPWHEQQCVFKPMKCFMGRIWGECKWQGMEVQWKQHLEEQHRDKLFCADSADLVWNLGIRRKPLTGYYVFQAHDEMFNFYEIYEKQRILFTMTCTSNRRESKYNYAYEVTLLQPDNEALSLTQKFPVHSEYDRDILMDGTCVTIGLNELARFVGDDNLLHYRVNVMVVKSPCRSKAVRQSLPLPIDYQQTRNVGVNGKSVPSCMIITRTYKEAIGEVAAETPDSGEGNGDDLQLERKWGTPQLHFNRKYLRNTSGDDVKEDELRPLKETSSSAGANEDKLSLCSTSTSYTRKVSETLRKSFRSLKADLIELRPFAKKKTTPKSAIAITTTKTTTTKTANTQD